MRYLRKCMHQIIKRTERGVYVFNALVVVWWDFMPGLTVPYLTYLTDERSMLW